MVVGGYCYQRTCKGLAMITMGIGLVAGVFYWLASYKLAFWILVYAIIFLRGISAM